jgi:hypothetical protein
VEPYREGEKPVEHYNRTEVELARIREQEETKRQRTLQVEKTKQASRSTEGYWVVRGLAIIAALGSVVTVCVAGYDAYSDKMHAEHPSFSDSHCTETAEIVNVGTSQRACGVGGWFEAKPTDKVGETLIRCHCGPKPETTAPAPPASSAP